jgi:hypothetical protein
VCLDEVRPVQLLSNTQKTVAKEFEALVGIEHSSNFSVDFNVTDAAHRHVDPLIPRGEHDMPLLAAFHRVLRPDEDFLDLPNVSFAFNDVVHGVYVVAGQQ